MNSRLYIIDVASKRNVEIPRCGEVRGDFAAMRYSDTMNDIFFDEVSVMRTKIGEFLSRGVPQVTLVCRSHAHVMSFFS